MTRKRLTSFAIKLPVFLLLLFALDRVIAHGMLRGLETYYGLDGPAEILLIGHSHTVLGVDKNLLEQRTGLNVAKYARQGANAADRLAMVRQYMDRHADDLRLVIYDVSAYSFSSAELSANSYRLFYPFVGDAAVQQYFRDADVPKLQILLREVSHASRFSEVTVGLSLRGWSRNWSNFKSGQVDLDRVRQQVAGDQVRNIQFDPVETAIIEQTITEVTGQGIPLALAFYPTIDLYNSTNAEKFAAAFERLSEYADGSDMVVLFDFVTDLQSRHELFYDPIHMNPAGQKVVTDMLADMILELPIDTGQ